MSQKKGHFLHSFGHDKKDFANMPQGVEMKEFPKESTFAEELDDTITGIDESVDHGKGKAKKYLSNQK